MGVLTDARKQHRYQTCRDEDCQRFACRVYSEGYRNGHDDGAAEARKAAPRATQGQRRLQRGLRRATTTATRDGLLRWLSAGAASCGDG